MTENSINDLADRIQGDVKTDFFTRKTYSIDASIYQVEPFGIVCPKSNQDIKEVIAFSRKNGIPVIPRGAGTGITGGCLGSGLIVDTSKYLNRILEINNERQYAVCEPGVVQDQLNATLAEGGHRLGPDTSTGNRATIGGMTGNNASGSHSILYGKMVDAVLETELVLASGRLIRLAPYSEFPLSDGAKNSSVTEIYRAVFDLCSELKGVIQERYPKIQRRVSGYNLDELITDGPLNLAKLITGSEGTLGITTAIKVRTHPKPAHIGMFILTFNSLITALNAVETILEFSPFAIELIDHHILEYARTNPIMYNAARWLAGIPAAMLAVEFIGESESQLAERLNAVESKMNFIKSSQTVVRLVNPTDVSEIHKIRKSGLGLLMARRSNDRAIAFLEDIAVPVTKLGRFMKEFRSYIRGVGKDAGFYGHAGVGCIHVRPMLDLNRESDIDIMVKMMDDISDLVLSYGGALSGEHGDGLVRSWLNEKMFGPKIYQAFKDIKAIFDPENVMNPGKIVNAQGPRENLRAALRNRSKDVDTVFEFTDEGGFGFSLSMCNGNGECRKTTSGTMCPSFHVTNDERDTTRARAQSLSAMISSDTSLCGAKSEELYHILDLCLECKACKSECPSRIDMAKMKSEFLYHYYKGHRRPIRDRIFGGVDKFNRLGSALFPLSNIAVTSSIHKWLMNSIGIDRRRELPLFSKQKFSTWFRKHQSKSTVPNRDKDKIVLFVDTFTEYNYPEIGIAAVEVLERLDCHVVIAEVRCCARPLISKGLLDQARKKAIRILSDLSGYVDKGYRIIGLEPSCILTLKDEYPALTKDYRASRVSSACSTIDMYLNELLSRGEFALPFSSEATNVYVHGHCHQKAVEGMKPSLNVLKTIPGLSVKEINSGCCGMAGSFGYEREHYEFSLAVGETRLFPSVRALKKDAVLVANGISCRQQIKHGTNRDAKHMISVVAGRLA